MAVATHNPNPAEPAHASPARGPRQPPSEADRDQQALTLTADGDLQHALARMAEERVKKMPEADLEAELTKRGYHFDGRGWVK